MTLLLRMRELFANHGYILRCPVAVVDVEICVIGIIRWIEGDKTLAVEAPATVVLVDGITILDCCCGDVLPATIISYETKQWSSKRQRNRSSIPKPPAKFKLTCTFNGL